MFMQAELSNCLSMTLVVDPGKYLGLPTFWARSKHEALTFKGKFAKESWRLETTPLVSSGQRDSYKGRGPIGADIPYGNLQISKFFFCQKLEIEVAQFWWGQKGDERRVH